MKSKPVKKPTVHTIARARIADDTIQRHTLKMVAAGFNPMGNGAFRAVARLCPSTS